MMRSTRVERKKIIHLLFSFVFTLGLIGVPTGSAWAYSDLYVFGDSLSDQGNFLSFTQQQGLPPIPPPEYTDGTVNGRFTNGRNYIDYLAPMLGLASAPSNLGGNNYAYGGARTDSNPYLGPFAGLLGEYDTYAAAHAAADPNALYIVWAGANNLKDILQSPSPLTSDQIAAALSGAAGDVTTVVSLLAQSGARNILVPNVPDLGLTPLAMGGGGPNALASNLTQSYNAILSGDLDAILGINLMRFDAYGFLDDIYYSGIFPNVTDAAYSKFVEAGGTTVTDPQDYLSWDGFHPTTAAHGLLAQDIYGVVTPEPSSALLIAMGVIAGLLFMGRASPERR
jgi:outer membrane lipase/esterase